MWTPHEVRKIIAQVSGAALLGAGVWVSVWVAPIALGSNPKSNININIGDISGTMSSGSAGLFMLFLGFFLVLIPLLFAGTRGGAIAGVADHSEPWVDIAKADRRFLIIMFGLLISAVALLFGGNYMFIDMGMGIGVTFMVAGVILGLVGGAVLIEGIFNWGRTGHFSGLGGARSHIQKVPGDVVAEK